jgi:2-polyprenyl-3-methyl-5-hydroxy-6-metoxy-1,4-benzoquinol methylase
MTQPDKTAQQNIDPEEIAKFEELANKWWDKNSEFKPLHEINPLRVGFIDRIAQLSEKKTSWTLVAAAASYQNLWLSEAQPLLASIWAQHL